MKDRSLMDMIGKIDDEFIEEAANPKILLSKKKRWTRVLSPGKLGTLAACMVIVVGLVVSVPYINVSNKAGKDESAMQEAINAAVATQKAEQDAKDDALMSSVASDKAAQSVQNASLQSSIAADKVLQDDEAAKASAAAASASKAASEAATAAVSASKAASDAAASVSTVTSVTAVASKSVAYESAPSSVGESSQSAETSADTTQTTVTVSGTSSELEEPQTDFYQAGEIAFEYSDQTLFSIRVNNNYLLTEVVIPESIDHVTIIELAEDFWSFMDTNPSVQTVTIPDTIETFGNIKPLRKSVVMICSTGSPAEKYFTENGYTVQTK